MIYDVIDPFRYSKIINYELRPFLTTSLGNSYYSRPVENHRLAKFNAKVVLIGDFNVGIMNCDPRAKFLNFAANVRAGRIR